MVQSTSPTPTSQARSASAARGLRRRILAAPEVNVRVILGPGREGLLRVSKAQVLRKLRRWQRGGPIQAEMVFGALVLAYPA
jgi:hypothetical protein